MSYAEEQTVIEDAYEKGLADGEVKRYGTLAREYERGFKDGYEKRKSEESKKRVKGGKGRWKNVSAEKRTEHAKMMLSKRKRKQANTTTT